MKLDTDGLWVITPEQLKILSAAERLAETHDFIPQSLLKSRSFVSNRFADLVRELVVRKFLTYREKNLYKLTISGHDCLAVNTLRRRGLTALGSPIGIGKESDIYYGEYRGEPMAVKIHRLGRTSFRKVESRRLTETKNWFSMNRENCRREAEFLKKFSSLDVPELVDFDRHVMVMKLLDYDPLFQLRVDRPDVISCKMFGFIKEFWEAGYVHGDFNEFNVMVKDSEIKVVDFPQCIKRTDVRAGELLKRDIECVHQFFWRKNLYVCDDSILSDIILEAGIVIERIKKDEITWKGHYSRPFEELL